MSIKRAIQWPVLLISIVVFSVACGSGEPVELRPGDVAASGTINGAEWTFYDGVAEPQDGSDELYFTLSDDLIGGCGEVDSIGTIRFAGFSLAAEPGEYSAFIGLNDNDLSGSEWSFQGHSSSGTVTIDEVADGIIYGSFVADFEDENSASGDFAALDCR